MILSDIEQLSFYIKHLEEQDASKDEIKKYQRLLNKCNKLYVAILSITLNDCIAETVVMNKLNGIKRDVVFEDLIIKNSGINYKIYNNENIKLFDIKQKSNKYIIS